MGKKPKEKADNKYCGAKTRSGGTCRKYPIAGAKRCRLHGGLSLRGVNSPVFKSGRYSKYLPKRLLERFDAAEKDPDLLNLRSEIALVDTRLEDLLKRVDTGESGHLWSEARDFYDLLEAAIRNKDAPNAASQMSEALLGLKETISKAQTDYTAWREVQHCLEQRRKLVETEGKRLQIMQQFITTEQAMVLLAQITRSLQKNVTDPIALQAVSDDLIRLVSADPREYLGARAERSLLS